MLHLRPHCAANAICSYQQVILHLQPMTAAIQASRGTMQGCPMGLDMDTHEAQVETQLRHAYMPDGTSFKRVVRTMPTGT